MMTENNRDQSSSMPSDICPFSLVDLSKHISRILDHKLTLQTDSESDDNLMKSDIVISVGINVISI